MERVLKQNRESSDTKRAAQRQSAQHAAHDGIASRLNNSPHMTAQRRKLQGLFGGAAQLQGAEDETLQGKLAAAQRVEDEDALQGKFAMVQRVEEEEPLQGKFATAQRVEEEEPLQGKSATAQRVEEEEPLQGKFAAQTPAQLKEEAATKPNNTGLPDNLKSGIESLSGMAMDHVKVHYNSSQPAQLNALAYAQGSDIHVAPGQEQHLPHEAWHVVQQAQGRVKPTMQMKGGVPVNDDQALEAEADSMGGKAAQRAALPQAQDAGVRGVSGAPVAQRILRSRDKPKDEPTIFNPGNTPGFINLYARLMADDTSAMVDGKSGGGPGVFKVLKEAEVSGSTVKDALVESIMGSGSWRQLGNETAKTELATHVAEGIGTGLEEGSSVDDFIKDVAPDYLDFVEEWVANRLDSLDGADTVGAIASANVPKEWHEDLAQIVYDETKSIYYDKQAKKGTPFVPPFKKLIGDINNNAIARLKYVRKYGQNSGNPGAEFAVEAPQEKKDLYTGNTVLHTHYEDVTEAPNYAHTKPEAQKYALGFGYTVVDLQSVKAIDESKKKFDQLP